MLAKDKHIFLFFCGEKRKVYLTLTLVDNVIIILSYSGLYALESSESLVCSEAGCWPCPQTLNKVGQEHLRQRV